MSPITKLQSTATGAPTPPFCTEEPPEPYRFRVDQYEQMGRAGILTEEDRVELVEGVLYLKPMKKGTHSIAAREIAAALARTVPAETYFVTREDPVRIPGAPACPSPTFLSCVGVPATMLSCQKLATSHSSSKSRRKASHSTGPKSEIRTPEVEFRFTGSSTCWTAKSKSILRRGPKGIAPPRCTHLVWMYRSRSTAPPPVRSPSSSCSRKEAPFLSAARHRPSRLVCDAISDLLSLP